MINNRIGILFNSNLLLGLVQGRTKHESILNYEEAANLHDVQPVYFRLEDINPITMQVQAYVRCGSRYERRSMPLPRVIHNRAIYMRPGAHAKLRLLTSRDICIYNQVNRYGKLTIHKLLLQDPSIVPHLPETMLATRDAIAEMMLRHQSLILKPDNSSIGRGVMKTERTDGGWRAEYAIRTKSGKRVWKSAPCGSDGLSRVVMKRIAKENYLVQETLPLTRYNGRPFDLRVSVQREQSGRWQITGIVGKVAPAHTFVTNVAQGGRVLPFEQLAAASLPDIPFSVLHERVSQLSLCIAERLSCELPHMADLGLDIGISPNGTPLFIECNGRDQRYSFLEAQQTAVWKATYENPIAYGAGLIHRSLTV
ncbi:YheC/YheD family endospore coat-associated protein [Paenibacillus marinisediminis]